MVEVFKTNVSSERHATSLISLLQMAFPHYKINFDLEDCDKIYALKDIPFLQKALLHY
jgi:hypothetical protein